MTTRNRRTEETQEPLMTTPTQPTTQTQPAPQKPTNGNGSTAITKATPTKMDVLKETFERWAPTLKAILPKHIAPDRVMKIAMNVYLNKPELQACTPISMVRATVQAAEMGLDPSPLLGECAFVPFKNKKRVPDGNVFKEVAIDEVQLMPMYVGLIKLAKQTGDIADVYAVVVDECEYPPQFDESGKHTAGFYVVEGTSRAIFHIRAMQGRTGKLFAVYGVVKFKDGTDHFEVLTKDDVERYRKRSKQAEGPAWTNDYEAMAKKTAIKQAIKTVPKSPERPNLARALAADNSAEAGEAFRGELMSDAIDVEGVDTTPVEQPAQPQNRSEALADKLAGKGNGKVEHDPDGVIK